MDPKRLEELMIRAVDKEISDEEWQELQEWISAHPELHAEWEKWKMTQLPEEIMAYPDKHKLYRHHHRRMKYLYRLIAAAACIAGFWLIGKIWFAEFHHAQKPVAGQHGISLSGVAPFADEEAQSSKAVHTKNISHPSAHRPQNAKRLIRQVANKRIPAQNTQAIAKDTMDQFNEVTVIDADSVSSQFNQLPSLMTWNASPDEHIKILHAHDVIQLDAEFSSNKAEVKPVLSVSERGSAKLGRVIFAMARTANYAHKIQQSLFETQHIHIEFQEAKH